MPLNESLLSELNEAQLFEFSNGYTIEPQLNRVHICFNCCKLKFGIRDASPTY